MLAITQMSKYIVNMSNKTLAERVATEIKNAIEDAGVSKKSLSNLAGIPYATLNRKLMGNGEFTLTEIALISETLKLSPMRFYRAAAAISKQVA